MNLEFANLQVRFNKIYASKVVILVNIVKYLKVLLRDTAMVTNTYLKLWHFDRENQVNNVQSKIAHLGCCFSSLYFFSEKFELFSCYSFMFLS